MDAISVDSDSVLRVFGTRQNTVNFAPKCAALKKAKTDG